MAFLDETGLAELWSCIGKKYDSLYQHSWSREGAVPATYTLNAEADTTITLRNYGRAVYYAAAVTVADDGTVSLSGTVSKFSADGESEIASLNSIKGKFFYVDSNPSVIYFRTNGAAGTRYTEGGGNIYSYAPAQRVIGIPKTTNGEKVYLYSTNRNAYPDSGELNGAIYTYWGIPFDNAITAPKVVTGSYQGTGTYGETNKNSLTFDFEPKLVVVALNATYGGFPWVRGAEVGIVTHNANYRVQLTWDTNTVSWYSTNSNATYQLNSSSSTYYYIAIG